MSFSSRSIVEHTKYAAIWSGIIAFLILFSQWYVVSQIGYGGQFIQFISSFLVLPILLAFPAIPVGILLTLFHKTRRLGMLFLIYGFIFCGAIFSVMRVGQSIRMKAFNQLAVRSQPLVKAISHFADTKGHPPTSLQELIPEYLSVIPGTGMPSYPNYQYSTKSDTWNKNPWVVFVNTPIGMINWDMFIYFPLQNYPQEGYGGELQRIRDWAYVHE